MLDWLLIFVTTSLAFYWFSRKPKNFPPGPPAVPVLGSIPFLKPNHFHFFLEELKEKHGPVIGFMFGSHPTVAVCGALEVEEVLKRAEFQGRMDVSDKDNSANRKGIMFTEGSFWLEQRRFTLRNLRDFGFGKKTIERLILDEVEQFMQQMIHQKDTVQVSGLFNLPSINILWSIMGGQSFSYDDAEFRNLLGILQKLFRSGGFKQLGLFVFRRFPWLKPYFPELSGKQLEDSLKEFFVKSFREHEKTREAGFNRDFIDVYLAEIERLKGEESTFNMNTLRAVCHDLFAAGAESVGNTLGFSLLYLVLYPDWQEAVFREIEEVIGHHRQPSLDDKLRLPKVEAFLSEVMRCNPIAPQTVPHKATSDTTLAGYNIPEESTIFISLWSVLHDKQHWGDPQNFRPERFLSEEGEYLRDPWLMVFGLGKRLCLGESLARTSIFLFFTSLVQRYEFSIPKGHPQPSTLCMTGFTVAPQPFEVALRPRQST